MDFFFVEKTGNVEDHKFRRDDRRVIRNQKEREKKNWPGKRTGRERACSMQKNGGRFTQGRWAEYRAGTMDPQYRRGWPNSAVLPCLPPDTLSNRINQTLLLLNGVFSNRQALLYQLPPIQQIYFIIIRHHSHPLIPSYSLLLTLTHHLIETRSQCSISLYLQNS